MVRAVDVCNWGDAEDLDAITSAVSALDGLRAKLVAQLAVLQSDRESCVVCLDEPGQDDYVCLVRLAPCNHTQVCAGCAALLTHCPLCRSHIEAII